MKRIIATILIVLVLFFSVGYGHEETRVSPSSSSSSSPSPITSPSATPSSEPSHTPNISQYLENKEVLEQRLVHEEIDILTRQQDVAEGKYSYEVLTRFYLERIEKYQGCNAIITISKSAISDAQTCD